MLTIWVENTNGHYAPFLDNILSAKKELYDNEALNAGDMSWNKLLKWTLYSVFRQYSSVKGIVLPCSSQWWHYELTQTTKLHVIFHLYTIFFCKKELYDNVALNIGYMSWHKLHKWTLYSVFRQYSSVKGIVLPRSSQWWQYELTQTTQMDIIFRF